MKIAYCSDLHLEFGGLNQTMPDGDVLILGGDITLFAALDPEALGYYDGRALRERTEMFLDQCRDSFERIFLLIGNHECYGYDLDLAPKLIRRAFKGITLLENKAVPLSDDVLLVGATLWTDMNGGKDAWIVGGPRGLNDFRYITIEDREGTQDGINRQTRVFRPEDAMKRFARSKRFIARTAKANPDKIIVVATHHSPSIQGVSTQHVQFSNLNAGYYSDLHAFIAEHPNIRFWTHGHTHLQKAYRVHQCHVLSNARGYIGREHSADVFDPDCWFDPVTGKKKDPGKAKRRSRVQGDEVPS